MTRAREEVRPDDLSERIAGIVLSAQGKEFGSRDKAFARSFPDYLNADLFGLYIMRNRLRPRAILVSRPMERFLKEYEAFRKRDPIFLHLRRQRRAMDGVSLLGFEGWVRHPLARFLNSWKLHYTLQGAVFDSSGIVATLNFARREDQDPFAPEDVEKLESLCEHISSLFAFQSGGEQIRAPAREAASISAGCEVEGVSLILSDTEGDMIRCDPGALEIHPDLSASDIQADIARTVALMKQKGLNAVERNVVQGGRVLGQLTTLVLPGSNRFLTTLRMAGRSMEKRDEPIACNAVATFGDPADALGPRTRCVLELLVRGYSNKLIAREMRISENTVKDHVRRIYDHFGVGSRTELSWILHGQVS